MSTSKVLKIFLSINLLFNSFAMSSEECSREWALQGITNKTFRVIGLGLSSNSDPNAALNEARLSAFKDISAQLQTSIQSHSEIKETESSSKFSSSSILTSKLENLKGLKALKSGRYLNENITRCEVYEFNVQTAYEEIISKLTPFHEKLEKFESNAQHKQWLNLLREIPSLKGHATQISDDTQKADLFKTVLSIPGPSWSERLEKAKTLLSDSENKARSNIVIIFPENQFEAPVAEIESKVTNAGVKVAYSDRDIGPDSLGIELFLKELGKPVRTQTKLGLTITRKVLINLRDIKTKSKLAASNSLSIVGASPDQNEEKAIANGDSQLIAAIAEAMRNLAPGLIKED